MTNLKAFKVSVRVRGGHENQTRTMFVKANSKKEVEGAVDVIKVWPRSQMNPDQCPMMIVDEFIEPDDSYRDPY